MILAVLLEKNLAYVPNGRLTVLPMKSEFGQGPMGGHVIRVEFESLREALLGPVECPFLHVALAHAGVTGCGLQVHPLGPDLFR